MNVDIAKTEKTLRKLRTLLKIVPRDPSPDCVHQLRTHTRKLEAIVHFLSPRSTGAPRRLLKLIKPVRRAAGRVRDMDVLILKATNLSPRAHSEGVIRLIEHMAAIRTADATRLRRKIKEHRAKLRSRLKDLRRSLEQLGSSPQAAAPVGAEPVEVLARKLERWPRLSRRNLHEFRKGVKELRYMLQLVPNHHHDGMSAYQKVKDTAGDWHDWLELQCLAESVLDSKKDAPLLREIKTTVLKKLRVALNAANSVRKHSVPMFTPGVSRAKAGSVRRSLDSADSVADSVKDPRKARSILRKN